MTIRKMTPEEYEKCQNDHIAILNKIDSVNVERKKEAADFKKKLKKLAAEEAELRWQLEHKQFKPVQLDMVKGDEK